MEYIIKKNNNKFAYEIKSLGIKQSTKPFIDGLFSFKTELEAKKCAKLHLQIIAKEIEISREVDARVKAEIDPLIEQIKNL